MRRNVRRGITPFAAGAITLIVIAVASYVGFTKTNPFAEHKTVKAAFKSANDLKTGSPVRVAGVAVGKVSKIEKGDENGDGAVVTMELKPDAPPIKVDARMKVRPRIFLEGNYFVDVQPGSPSAPKLKGDEPLPVQQTASPVQFGQVLTALQTDTREDLRRVLQEYGDALDGGAEAYNRSIVYQEPAYKNSAINTQATLGILEHDLSGYVRGAGAVAEALDRNSAALKSLITDFAITADALADEQGNLSALIRELPSTLRIGRRALGSLNASFPPLRRFVADLRPAVRSSVPALRSGVPFLQQARRLVSEPELKGLVSDLRPTVPDLVELNEGGPALQEQLRLLSSCQNNVILPTTEEKVPDPNFPATGPVYQEAVKWLPGIAGESRSFDANGQYIRIFAGGANFAYALPSGGFFFTQRPLQGVTPPRSDPPPLRNDVPCETQEPPDLRTTVAPPPAARVVNHSAPGAAVRYEEAKERAVEWLRGNLEQIGLDDKLKVTLDDLTAGQIGQLAGAGG